MVVKRAIAPNPALILLAATAITLVGAKLWLISRCNCITPFWDQWEAEAERLYIPYLLNSLQFQDLFSAHNEHRILLTRLLGLAVLEANGFWDPVLQMCVNTAIYAAAIALLLAKLGRILDSLSLAALCLVSATTLALPFGWQNATWAFQSQFYFLLLVSFAAMATAHPALSFSPRWCVGLGLAVLAHFSFSAGTNTLAALAALSTIQIFCGRRSGSQEWAGVALLAALFVALAVSTPHAFSASIFRPESVTHFIKAVGVAASWPVGSWQLSGWLLLLTVAAVQGPLLVTCVYVIAKRPAIADHRWFVVAAGGWLALQFLTFSYGRGSVVHASRYLDVFAVSIPLSFACMLYLISTFRTWLRPLLVLALVWLALVGIGLYKEVRYISPPWIDAREREAQIQFENVRAFLATGDSTILHNKPDQHVPFPDSNRLVTMLKIPALRDILPPALTGKDMQGLDELKATALRGGPLLLVGGLLILILGFALLGAAEFQRARRPQDATA